MRRDAMNRMKATVGAALVASALWAVPVRAGDKLEYNRDVRPILAENCFSCHGTDSTARKADLRLDRRDAAVKAGAITPGKPDDSEMVDRITSTMSGRRMPPPKTGRKLTAAQKATLTRWIAEGADYQAHWALIAPKRPPLPAVKNAAWPRNPIDNFILAGLEKEGLTPAPEADRRTLARRASLDLTGLPPSPEAVEAFVNDPSPNAYEKYVDMLMASPQWGEQRARYWLDVARYADTHGIHFDNYREIWTYRDWVINAFNSNERFDQFTIDQLGGDLLPHPTVDQYVATGFNRCNITSNEGGLIPEEYLVLYTRDRTETTARVWLGLTAGCAVCHDHKFDPLSQKEFYSLSAFFNNTTQAAMDGNIKDTPPVMLIPKPEDRPRWDAVKKELPEVQKLADARKAAARGDFDKWLTGAAAGEVAASVPAGGLRVFAPLSEGDGKVIAVTVDGKPRQRTLGAGFGWDAGHVAAKALRARPGAAIELADAGDFDKDQGFSYGAWVKLTKSTPGAPSSPAWTTSTTSAAGTSGSRTTASAPTSSTSGRTTPSRWFQRTRSRWASGTTCSSAMTDRARRPASRSTSTASRRRQPSRPTGLRARSARPCL